MAHGARRGLRAGFAVTLLLAGHAARADAETEAETDLSNLTIEQLSDAAVGAPTVTR